MTPTTGFFAALLTTVFLLVLVTWTGMRGKLSWHLPFVALAVTSLGVAIYYARLLGDVYDIRAAGWIAPFHLTMAKVTTALYLAPLTTGIATLRNRKHRPLHRRVAFLVLGLTLLTTVTGAWMLYASPLIEPGV